MARPIYTNCLSLIQVQSIIDQSINRSININININMNMNMNMNINIYHIISYYIIYNKS